MSVYKNIGPRAAAAQNVKQFDNEVPNNAGGYVYKLNMWGQLNRFLILGSEGGTYYVSARKLTDGNVAIVKQCLAADAMRTVQMAADVLKDGKAFKTDPALVTLAMAVTTDLPVEVKLAAFKAVGNLRTTEFFQFIDLADEYRGWGRMMKEYVRRWYSRPLRVVALQMTKYRNRGARTHADALRQGHVRPISPAHSDLFLWATKGVEALSEKVVAAELRDSVMMGYEMAKLAKNVKEIVQIIRDYSLTWEMIPTEWHNTKEVWVELLMTMKPWALLRNLGRMQALGVFDDINNVMGVVSVLTDQDIVERERIHPVRALVAFTGYKSGHGRAHGGADGAEKKQLTWKPDMRILDAIEACMYLGFKTIKPTGKRLHLALDISGSMWGSKGVCGVPELDAATASAVVAMATVRSEPTVLITGFTTTFEEVDLRKTDSLEDVLRKTRELSRRMGGTDCAKPMVWSLEHKAKFDGFAVYTDSETWAGQVKPVAALKKYRVEMNIPARLAVVGMVSNEFSIADPDDAGMLDVVGMSTDTPMMISKFLAGEI
jgi:60 kDa SS-A/Ro ribonucleoprotein